MDFTTKSPQIISEYIRWWLGGLSEGSLSTDDMIRIIELESNSNPSLNGCDLLYKSTLSVLKYLIRIRDNIQTGSSGGTSGTYIKSQEEKVGSATIKTSWGTLASGVTVISGFEQTLSDLQSNPDSIGCPVTQGGTSVKGVGQPHFGGVSQKEYDRVRNDPDSRNGYHTSSPFRQHLK